MRKRKEKTKINAKKGFTLVELLVTIACSSVILLTLTGSIIFITKVNNNLVSKSSNLYKINLVKEYILDNYEGYDVSSVSCTNGNVYFKQNNGSEPKEIVTNSLITEIIFNKENKINGNETENTYIVCKILYNDTKDKEYKFIVR